MFVSGEVHTSKDFGKKHETDGDRWEEMLLRRQSEYAADEEVDVDDGR